MAERRDHVAVNISPGARRARLGVSDQGGRSAFGFLAGHPRANSLTSFSIQRIASLFDDYSACRSFVWGPHEPTRCHLVSPRESAVVSRGGGASRRASVPRVRAQRQTRAEATREATGERTSSLFAQGAHSRQARPPAPAGGDESGWMLLRLSVASPSATFPHQRRVFRRRGMGAACTSPKASSAASPETVSPSAGPSLERIPAAGASRRRDPILPPVAASLSSPVVPRPRSPPRLFPSPQPRSRREQNRGGAR